MLLHFIRLGKKFHRETKLSRLTATFRPQQADIKYDGWALRALDTSRPNGDPGLCLKPPTAKSRRLQTAMRRQAGFDPHIAKPAEPLCILTLLEHSVSAAAKRR
jgi:hypothetical protein